MPQKVLRRAKDFPSREYSKNIMSLVKDFAEVILDFNGAIPYLYKEIYYEAMTG